MVRKTRPKPIIEVVEAKSKRSGVVTPPTSTMLKSTLSGFGKDNMKKLYKPQIKNCIEKIHRYYL